MTTTTKAPCAFCGRELNSDYHFTSTLNGDDVLRCPRCREETLVPRQRFRVRVARRYLYDAAPLEWTLNRDEAMLFDTYDGAVYAAANVIVGNPGVRYANIEPTTGTTPSGVVSALLTEKENTK